MGHETLLTGMDCGDVVAVEGSVAARHNRRSRISTTTLSCLELISLQIKKTTLELLRVIHILKNVRGA